MAAIDNMVDAVGAVNGVMGEIAAKRALLQGYKDSRDQFAALVTATKAELDILVAAAKSPLQDLAAKIDAALPPGT